MPKTTMKCRERLKPIFDKFGSVEATQNWENTGTSGGAIPFFAGFIAGQCEKVYHGACAAAMFAYGSGLYPMTYEAFVSTFCEVWGAYELIGLHDEVRQEIWVTRTAINEVTDVLTFNHNTEERTRLWTRKRASLCGIAAANVADGYDLPASPASSDSGTS